MSENNYNELILTPKHKVDKWGELVSNKIKNGEQVVVFFDTETTGGVSGATISVIEKHGKDEGKLHRIVELGAIITIQNQETGTFSILRDEDGEEVRFHEYINPWAEKREDLKRTNTIDNMPYGAYCVHGIQENFLLGNENLGANIPNEKLESDFILSQPAPTFEQILIPFLKITGLSHVIEDHSVEKIVKALAHNIEFDNKFMNSEFRLQNLSEFEAYCSPMCSLKIFRSILPKDEVNKKYSLDNIYNYTRGLEGTQVEDIPRDVHGAYIDSKMLLQVTNEVLSTPFAIKSPNAIFHEEENINYDFDIHSNMVIDSEIDFDYDENNTFNEIQEFTEIKNKEQELNNKSIKKRNNQLTML
jgi:DNA polymerase III epsilon subunit-like protein